MNYILKKLLRPRIWTKVFVDRLSEPVHLNVLAACVAIFGSLRAKAAFDLVVRPHHAFGILKCAEYASRLGLKTISLIEFGVASGSGLLNIADIARRATRETGIEFKIYGFDTGKGMPPARDYRDHPDLFQLGDFPMNVEELRKRLPQNTRLIIGEIGETVSGFLRNLPPTEPIGFVSFDVDYYYSTRDALKIFTDPNSEKYLPITTLYLDDIALEPHNPWCGVLLAVDEFNAENPLRKIARPEFLETRRIFRRAAWLKQIRRLHVLDHPVRSEIRPSEEKRVIENPYLSYQGNAERFQVSGKP